MTAAARRGCSVAGCPRPHHARGLCRTHYERARRRRPRPRAARHLGYDAAHRRVRAARGRATDQPCESCGAPAAAWCYDCADPNELSDARGRHYSLDPDHYRACCRYCRRRAEVDRSSPLPIVWQRPALDVEAAARLYCAGASSRGVAALMGVSRGVVLRALRTAGVPIRPPVAPRRRPRRYPVTPRPHRPSSFPRGQEPDPSHSTPIFTNQSATPTTRLSNTTSPTSTDQTHEQEQPPQTQPQSQYGPTHQRSHGGCRRPCGPAAPEFQDPLEEA